MTGAALWALSPYLGLGGGIVLLLLVVAWLRSARVAFGGSLVVLLAGLAAVPFAAGAGTQDVDGFMEVDGFALFFFALFVLAAIDTAVFAYRYLRPRAQHLQEFYILLAIAVLGGAVAAAASHFAAFLLGIEVLSISLYAMIAYPRAGRPPLEAAAKYLVLSGAASSTILFGMALVYAATGRLDFAAAGELAYADGLILAFGQAMLLAGVFFKLSLVPFHMWTPDVYHGAPAPVTGFVATVSKGAVFAVLLRYALDSEMLAGDSNVIGTVIVVVAVLSMVGGNLLALLQTNIKRLLAYSSIAHIGYLLVALVAAATPAGRALGVETALVYLTGYFVMTLAAFGVITVLSGDDQDAEELDFYEGLLWTRPALAAVLIAAALSLAGIPLTVGFIAKFYLVAAGVDAGAWLLIWALILGSAIGVYYYLRIVFAMTKRTDRAPDKRRLHWEGVVTVLVLGVAILLIGVYPEPMIELVRGLEGP